MMETHAERSRDLRLIITGDGSHTLYVPSLNEHYHSVFGAVQESRHIYIGAGLNYPGPVSGSVNLLEVGFGTGLNALLTCLEAESLGIIVRYQSLEMYPLSVEMTSQLNFPEQMTSQIKSGIEMTSQTIPALFRKIHAAPWNEWAEITEWFIVNKTHADLKTFVADPELFDLVYFDAFGPDVQPQMWTADIFRMLFRAMKPGAVLVTYSTKGVVKRNLKSAGFEIEKLPGPPGKREILRAARK
jgi:tRNA U34 5-methylaminomethyl-2-thiouridine-forming methyltransferase MnmC